MHISKDQEKGTYTFVPTTESEELLFNHIAESVPTGQRLNYKGVFAYPGYTTDDTFIRVKLVFEGIELFLQGDTEEQKWLVNGVSDMCWHGSSGLIFVRSQKTGSQTMLVFTGCLCKVCSAPTIGLRGVEWKTCDACAKNCTHQLEVGYIHGGKIEVGLGEFCNKCGTVVNKIEGHVANKVVSHV